MSIGNMRKKNYQQLMRNAPLENDQGVLTPKRRILPSVEVRVSLPGKSEKLPQKNLVDEMREMHEEQMQAFQTLIETMQKLAESGIAIQSSQAIINEPRRGQSTAANLNAPAGIEMDESIFVTEVDTSGMEKGFDELAETKIEKDSALKSNLAKLRALKTGE